LQEKQQVIRLLSRVTDEASTSVAALLPQAMSFLLTTLDGCTAEQLADSAPLATCARQCLFGIMHMLAHRYQAMVAVDAGVKAAPCIAAQRFAAFLEAAAAGHVAAMHPQHLRDLLEAFFDMQRVVCCFCRMPHETWLYGHEWIAKHNCLAHKLQRCYVMRDCLECDVRYRLFSEFLNCKNSSTRCAVSLQHHVVLVDV
jgi:hypothetical protein